MRFLPVCSSIAPRVVSLFLLGFGPKPRARQVAVYLRAAGAHVRWFLPRRRIVAEQVLTLPGEGSAGDQPWRIRSQPI